MNERRRELETLIAGCQRELRELAKKEQLDRLARRLATAIGGLSEDFFLTHDLPDDLSAWRRVAGYFGPCLDEELFFAMWADVRSIMFAAP